MGPSYQIDSKEWTSINFREGFAHFIAARVWNEATENGKFRWFGVTYDLEKWDSGNTPGGRTRNVCCTSAMSCASSLAGASTNQDWLLAFWDLYNYTGCSPTLNRERMLMWHRDTIDWWLQDENLFYDMSRGALQGLVSAGVLGSCFDDAWEDTYACHNGIAFWRESCAL